MQRVMSAAVLALGLGAAAHAGPVGTAFTYQGQLTDGGQLANGSYDFIFRLFDAAGGGIQAGADYPVNDQNVAEGLFTVSLDFGPVAFDGSARWLEISVRAGASGGAYTALTPRQPLTATPYALHALNTYWELDGDALTNSEAGFVGIHRTTPVTGAEVFGVYSDTTSYGGMYMQTAGAGSKPFYGYDTPDYRAWTYLDGGTGSWHLYIDGDERMSVTNTGNVGIGDTTPETRLDVTTTSGDAVSGSTTGASSNGVLGVGTSAGVRGECGTSNGAGVTGVNNNSTGTGVRGSTSGTGGAAGVAGFANFGTGVYGQTSTGYGVYGSNGGSGTDGYAGYFNGRVHVAGTLSKAGGSFKIDHPLDPEHMYLYHSFVESPERMNIYNGIAALDARGQAEITLPDWFEALNGEYRYQLTALGAPAPNLHVAREIVDGQFAVAGGTPGMKVSWQVTGVRRDAWALANPLNVEEEKSEAERGYYLHPEAYGLTPADGIPQATGAVVPETTE